MKRIKFPKRVSLLIVAALLLGGLGLFKLSGTPAETPPVQFTDLAGQPHKLSDFRGKTIILNFWASWCAPCVREFPALLAAAQKHRGTAVLIALSADLSDEAITGFLQQMEAQNLPVKAPNVIIARDKDDIAYKNFQISQFPVTFVIDGKGRIRTRLTGAGWHPADLESFLREP